MIAGVQKCGTSSLAATLRRHPDVFMARPKELHFFDRSFDRGLDWYADQFRPRPRHKVSGEATPSYLFFADSRARLASSLPDAKIVVMLREPAKRAYSHYWHSRRLGVEDLDFETALEREPERTSTGERKDANRYSYVARGRYLEQLQDLLAQGVQRERLHVILLDDLIGRREETLEQLFTFLDIDASHAHKIPEVWVNRYRASTAPGERPKPTPYPAIDPATRSRLVETFAADNDRLGEWLGRDLSHWNRA